MNYAYTTGNRDFYHSLITFRRPQSWGDEEKNDTCGDGTQDLGHLYGAHYAYTTGNRDFYQGYRDYLQMPAVVGSSPAFAISFFASKYTSQSPVQFSKTTLARTGGRAGVKLRFKKVHP